MLEYVGREDSQVKVNGSRLELADLETTLLAQPSVADCAVCAVTGADGLVSQLVAYVVPRGHEESRRHGAGPAGRVRRVHAAGDFQDLGRAAAERRRQGGPLTIGRQT
nr:hypothetical protein GCM10020093_073340 [Planobispora longispora]